MGSYLYVGFFFLLHRVEIKKKGDDPEFFEFMGIVLWMDFLTRAQGLAVGCRMEEPFFPMSGFSARHLSSGVNPLPVDCHD